MNLYKILLALLILSLLAACSSDKENDVYTTLPFSLSIYQVAMTIEGGEQEVNVSSGGAWQSSIHCDWMTLSPSSGGIGITKVRIKVKENTSGLPRNRRRRRLSSFVESDYRRSNYSCGLCEQFVLSTYRYGCRTTCKGQS